MVKTLEEYVVEATNAYKPSTTAVQSQLDALSGQLETTNQAINKNYAQQQARLNQNQNQAAEDASMQAAGSGGSFGGAANLANRKYYERTFVPAVTQMRTNQSNDLAAARQANDTARNSLNTQLANIQSQAANQGTNQYYSDTNAEIARQYQAQQAQLDREYQAQQAELERQFQAQQAEANRAIQRQQIAASNSYNNYLMQAAKNAQASQNSQPTYKNWDFGNGYSIQEVNGQATYRRNGAPISAGEFLEGTSRYGKNWDLWNDVWNNGVSTNGVGSDTVEAYGNMYGTRAPLSLSTTPTISNSKYSYLY